jgi:hypothetical protein
MSTVDAEEAVALLVVGLADGHEVVLPGGIDDVQHALDAIDGDLLALEEDEQCQSILMNGICACDGIAYV